MDVAVLVFEEAIALPPVGSHDLLRKAAELHAQVTGKSDGPPAIRSELVAVHRRRTVAWGGMEVRSERTIRDVDRADLVIVPALPDDIVAALAFNRAVVPWLRRLHRLGAEVASICTGAFVLAEAGLLDGRGATTHWAAHDLFRARYPGVDLRPQQVLVDEGRVITSGGASTFLHLLMYLVEKHLGRRTASVASRMFLIEPQGTSPMAFAIFSPQKQHGDREVLRAQELIEADAARGISVAVVSRAVALSPRTFVRRFKVATGNTPLEYIQRTRIEAAKRLLETTPSTLGEIVRSVGYEDTASFRKVFAKHVGITPTAYRQRYQADSDQAL